MADKIINLKDVTGIKYNNNGVFEVLHEVKQTSENYGKDRRYPIFKLMNAESYLYGLMFSNPSVPTSKLMEIVCEILLNGNKKPIATVLPYGFTWEKYTAIELGNPQATSEWAFYGSPSYKYIKILEENITESNGELIISFPFGFDVSKISYSFTWFGCDTRIEDYRNSAPPTKIHSSFQNEAGRFIINTDATSKAIEYQIHYCFEVSNLNTMLERVPIKYSFNSNIESANGLFALAAERTNSPLGELIEKNVLDSDTTYLEDMNDTNFSHPTESGSTISFGKALHGDQITTEIIYPADLIEMEPSVVAYDDDENEIQMSGTINNIVPTINGEDGLEYGLKEYRIAFNTKAVITNNNKNTHITSYKIKNKIKTFYYASMGYDKTLHTIGKVAHTTMASFGGSAPQLSSTQKLKNFYASIYGQEENGLRRKIQYILNGATHLPFLIIGNPYNKVAASIWNPLEPDKPTSTLPNFNAESRLTPLKICVAKPTVGLFKYLGTNNDGSDSIFSQNTIRISVFQILKGHAYNNTLEPDIVYNTTSDGKMYDLTYLTNNTTTLRPLNVNGLVLGNAYAGVDSQNNMEFTLTKGSSTVSQTNNSGDITMYRYSNGSTAIKINSLTKKNANTVLYAIVVYE